MAGLRPEVDPEGLLEYSVVYTDRSVNHMSGRFQKAMREVSRILKLVYNGSSAIIVPGSGTFGMEAVARQFATGKRCLVVRNGLFSFRWSQIFATCGITDDVKVLQARPDSGAIDATWRPADVGSVTDEIRHSKSQLVFVPHVETSSGIMLPDDYIQKLADAVHDVGGMLVLDCVASGAMWVDMKALGVDILVTAPQKGWSGPPCCAMVVLGERAVTAIPGTTSTSFACDLKKWMQIMETYENGAHAYHATPPTDSIVKLASVMQEMEAFGFDKARDRQAELGERVRKILGARGFKILAAPGFEAPGVVVCHTGKAEYQNGKAFAALGMQVAGGVPLQCDEPEGFRTFRLGLFGLDKLYDPDRTVRVLEETLVKLG